MGKQLEGKYLDKSLKRKAAINVQKKAADQLLRLWRAGVKKRNFPPLWGDEIEYCIAKVDEKSRQATLVLKQSALLEQLDGTGHASEYSPEFARYMVEGMPDVPYGMEIKDLLEVEKSMRTRLGVIDTISPSQ
jgi:glutamate--cysteine ligase catalytic subunit